MPNGMNHHAKVRESIRRRVPRSTVRRPVKTTGSVPRCQRCTTSRTVPILGRATPTCIHARRCQPPFDAPRQQAPTDPTPMQPLICFFPQPPTRAGSVRSGTRFPHARHPTLCIFARVATALAPLHTPLSSGLQLVCDETCSRTL